MCMVDDADGWECTSSTHPKARKEHACSECGRTISRGETYRRFNGLIEGRWYCYQTCAHCEVAAGWLMEVCSGYLFEGVLEDLGEHWSEYEMRHYWLGRYILSMSRKWRNGRGELMPVPDLHLPAKYLAAAA